MELARAGKLIDEPWRARRAQLGDRTLTHSPLARSAVAIIAALAASVTFAKDIVLHAGTLFDGIADTERRGVSVLIRDDKIVSIEPGFTSPAGADVIDLSGATVLPGLIDCHVHDLTPAIALRRGMLGAAHRAVRA